MRRRLYSWPSTASGRLLDLDAYGDRCPREIQVPPQQFRKVSKEIMRDMSGELLFKERHLLRGQLNALGAGRGSVVLVTGSAGVGKTTLLAEAASLAADGGILVFCGGGDPAARTVPLGAILDALVSTDDPAVDPERLHELSQSPDQRFWLLRELQESLEKAASVLGHSFSLDELAGLLGRPPLDLRSEIREAMAAGLLTEEGNRLAFRHDLVREAVDASLPRAVRRSMRRTAVEVMLQHGASATDVAQLVMDVAETGDIASAGLLRRAAAQIGQVSPAVAVPLSRRALDLMPRGGPGRGEAVVQTIDLLVQAGRAAEAARFLTASESDLADPVAEAQARLGIAC